MAKQINFTFKGNDYTLEFTKRTVQQMENEGFVAQDIDKRPMTILPALFAGAFKAHHKWVKKEVIDEIYKSMINKESLIQALSEMYNEPIMGLIEEPTSNAEGNVEWVQSW